MFFQKPIIHYIIEAILFVIIIVLVSTCKNAEEETTAHVTPVTKFRGQKMAPIKGDEFGNGTDQNTDLMKVVAISWKGPQHKYLKVPRAYIQKAETLSKLRFSYVIPVRNKSYKHAYCGIKSVGLTFLNSEFSKIYTDTFDSKAYSSIGLANSTDWEHCIKPRGIGYIVGNADSLALDPYDKVAYVELGITYTSDSVINSGAKVEASSYVVNDEWLDVSVKNNGYDTAYVWPYTSIILTLDEINRPIKWDYLNKNLQMPIRIDPTVDTTNDLPILKSKIDFNGTSSRARFLITFSTSKIYPF